MDYWQHPEPGMNLYAQEFPKILVERSGSRFQYYDRLRADLLRTQKLKSVDTVVVLFNPSVDCEEESHFGPVE